MPDEEYALTPQSEIKKMKLEIERLKKNPLGEGRSARDLFESMDKLDKTINDLINIFKDVTNGMKGDQPVAAAPMGDGVGSKIDKMADENQKIAEGILSLADLIKENIEKQKELTEKIERSESPRPLRAPPVNVFTAPGSQTTVAPPAHIAPGPMPPPGIGPGGPPDTPPPEMRKHGLFDKLHK